MLVCQVYVVKLEWTVGTVSISLILVSGSYGSPPCQRVPGTVVLAALCDADRFVTTDRHARVHYGGDEYGRGSVHTQGYPLVPLVRGVESQDQGRLRPDLLLAGCPQGPHPTQQLREAGRHVHLRLRTPGANPVAVVAGPFPQFPAHRLEAPVGLQGRRHRILAAVVDQQQAPQPQGQAPPQATLDRGQVPLEFAVQGIQWSRTKHGHTPGTGLG